MPFPEPEDALCVSVDRGGGSAPDHQVSLLGREQPGGAALAALAAGEGRRVGQQRDARCGQLFGVVVLAVSAAAQSCHLEGAVLLPQLAEHGVSAIY